MIERNVPIRNNLWILLHDMLGPVNARERIGGSVRLAVYRFGRAEIASVDGPTRLTVNR